MHTICIAAAMLVLIPAHTDHLSSSVGLFGKYNVLQVIHKPLLSWHHGITAPSVLKYFPSPL